MELKLNTIQLNYLKYLKVIRNTPGKYAVIGLPSFIMELRLLCEADPIMEDRIKYMVG